MAISIRVWLATAGSKSPLSSACRPYATVRAPSPSSE